MTWTPLTQGNALAVLVGIHEKTTFDLKQRYDLQRRGVRHELAKDIAAFANTVGGTILVGAIEETDPAGRLTGKIHQLIGVPDVAALVSAVTSAAGDLCRPLPITEPEALVLDTSQVGTITGQVAQASITLVAINVPPLLSGPVGCRPSDRVGTTISDAYRFPVRISEGTRFLSPEQLAFHMNFDERRLLLQLQSLPDRQVVSVWDRAPSGVLSSWSQSFRIVSFDTEHLAVSLARIDVEVEQPGTVAVIPLVFVRAVWRDVRNIWNLAVHGTLRDSSRNELVFKPDV